MDGGCIFVCDMKYSGEKDGNNIWVDLLFEVEWIIEVMLMKDGVLIFFYNF